eukprot:31174-Pelagococcus_subviridis.AAC.2
MSSLRSFGDINAPCPDGDAIASCVRALNGRPPSGDAMVPLLVESVLISRVGCDAPRNAGDVVVAAA